MSSAHTLRWVGAEAFVASPVLPSPTILRFDGDDFMDRMLSLLEHEPQALPGLVARYETWAGLGLPTPESVPPRVSGASRTARLLARAAGLRGFRRADHAPSSPHGDASPADPALKLFQPVHQRYYLAAAHLVCELPGLPPRVPGPGDKSGFVLRRLYTVDGQVTEHAFIKPPGQSGQWSPLDAHSASPDGEEWLPVFPLNYAPPSGPRRALLGGLVPVARHDEYLFAHRVKRNDAGGDENAWSELDDVKALARMKVIAPWQALIERAYLSGAAATPPAASSQNPPPWGTGGPSQDARVLLLEQANDQLVEASWRHLQEMREFLQSAFSELSDERLASGDAPANRPQLQALLDLLGQETWTPPPTPSRPQDPQLSASVRALDLTHKSLRSALAAMTSGVSDALDATTNSFPSGSGWPGFAFPLVALRGDTEPDGLASVARLAGPFLAWLGFEDNPSEGRQDAANRRLELLNDRIDAAIDEAGAAGTLRHAAQSPAAARLAQQLGKALADDPGSARFVLRFMHRRTDCGPLHPLVVSAPSEQFELAGFFDSDAPLRPIRIALPFDTTPGGMRKFGKNSAFIMSDVLCGQMKRMRRMGFGDMVLSVLPWPFHKDLDVGAGAPCGSGSPGGSFGTICSLSIPIITLVAFILLIVIATLLDLIFRWLPFLMACFPVPGLKGKR